MRIRSDSGKNYLTNDRCWINFSQLLIEWQAISGKVKKRKREIDGACTDLRPPDKKLRGQKY